MATASSNFEMVTCQAMAFFRVFNPFYVLVHLAHDIAEAGAIMGAMLREQQPWKSGQRSHCRLQKRQVLQYEP